MARPKEKGFMSMSDVNFDPFFENFRAYILHKTASGDWRHIPEAAISQLGTAWTAWHSAWLRLKGPHTHADTRRKMDLRRRAGQIIRNFNNAWLRFSNAVTDEDRIILRLVEPDPSARRAPDFHALIVDVQNLGGYRVEIAFQNEKTPGSRDIPFGFTGCLLLYAWSPEKLADHALLVRNVLMKVNPFVLKLPPETEDKYLSLAIRWQDGNGDSGPLSEISHIVVI